MRVTVLLRFFLLLFFFPVLLHGLFMGIGDLIRSDFMLLLQSRTVRIAKYTARTADHLLLMTD